MIEERKNEIIDKLNKNDYASAYDLCHYLRIELINSVCFNDDKEFTQILQCLDEIRNSVNERVKDPKKKEEKDMSFVREMKGVLQKVGEKELLEFFEKLIRASYDIGYDIGAVSGFVNSLYDVGSQFEEKSFVPHLTRFEDLLFLISSPRYFEFRERGPIEQVDDTDTTIAELMKRKIIKIDENKTAFLTNKGDDLIKYSEISPDVERLLKGPVSREIEDYTIEKIERIPAQILQSRVGGGISGW